MAWISHSSTQHRPKLQDYGHGAIVSYVMVVYLPGYQHQIIGYFLMTVIASWNRLVVWVKVELMTEQLIHFQRHIVVPSCFCHWYNSVGGSIHE